MEQTSQTNENTYEITFRFKTMKEMNKFTCEYDSWRDSICQKERKKHILVEADTQRSFEINRRRQLQRAEQEKIRKRTQDMFDGIVSL